MSLKHTVEEITLQNGAKGLLIDVPGATLAGVDMQFRAGTHYADRKISQVAHIMEHMAFGPNARYDSIEAFDRALSKRGAMVDASTDAIGMDYNVVCAELELERIVDLLCLAISEPRFNDEVLQAEKGNVTEEMTGYLDIDDRVLWQQSMQALGFDEWQDARHIETIDVVTLADIQAHHRATYTTNNLRFIIAGDVGRHKKALIARLEALPLPKGERLEVSRIRAHRAELVHISKREAKVLTFKLTALLNRDLTISELTAIGIVNTILSGTYYSRIYGEARRRGISYSVSADSDRYQSHVAEFTVEGEVTNDNLVELMTLIAGELRRLMAGDITRREVDDAVELRLGRHQFSAPTAPGVGTWYRDDYFEYGEIDSPETYERDVQQVTVESVTAISRAFLASGIWGFGIIGNIDKADAVKCQALFEAVFGKGGAHE